VDGLSDADATVQSMDDSSPAKWHLAHTTWFFETFVLAPYVPGYRVFDEHFGYLFNSYYDAVGDRQPRPRRGMLTRPALHRVLDYRAQVDDAMLRLLEGARDAAVLERVELGIHHEHQHQELLLADILHLFAQNPLLPAYRFAPPAAPTVVAGGDRAGNPGGSGATTAGMAWISVPGGIVDVGAGSGGFAFDCERPRHPVVLQPFSLASRPVLNSEWLAFVQDGGYAAPSLWLADGWERVQQQGWTAPLYWRGGGQDWQTMTLRGLQPVDPMAPVCHLSWFEAEAFARWAGKRLPTEFEWERAAADQPVAGNFADSGRLQPAPPDASAPGFASLFGDVWEWTASDFAPYPRFQPLAGGLGEYNGKFMHGQRVLRGGSCVTPAGHVRATYRNFFQPEKRWQFSGLRLAEDS
jgi:ergothioneine biosynthesis protein EgtB